MKKKVVRSSIVVAILVAIEMVIKIIIDVFFMEKKLIFFEQFGFKPHLNTTQLSMFNNELDMGVSTAALIVLNIALILLVPVGLYFLHRNDDLCDAIYVVQDLLMAGMVCSLLDKVFWGGSLDYIYLFGRWIVDLKDIYMVAGLVVYIYCGVECMMRQYRVKKAVSDGLVK